MDIRPMPDKQGVGFYSLAPLTEDDRKAIANNGIWFRYREEVAGRYHNFYFTPDCCFWPEHLWYSNKICEPYPIVDALVASTLKARMRQLEKRLRRTTPQPSRP